MARRASTVFALIGTVLAMASTAGAQPVQSTQDMLIELERGWNDAIYRQDADFVAGLLADEFIVTYDDGTRGDKARELELVATFNQAVVSSVQDNFTVEVYEDTAVVWFTLDLVGLRQGQEVELTLLYTDVWILRDGRWQCVSSQSTRVRG